jgi:hypothetical protein
MDNSEENQGPTINLPTIGEIADKLFEQGKVSNMEAAQLKMWATAKPDKDAAPGRLAAWKKAMPVDIPELSDLWQYNKE